MDETRYITIDDLCSRYEIEVSFVRELGEFGLLQIVNESGSECIEHDALSDVERMIRLHYDLDINMPGLEAIHHLLERVHEMQKELIALRNRIGNK